MSLEQDTATVESLLQAVYSGISGQRPDWDRLTPLFHPDARLVPPARENDSFTALTFARFVERSTKAAESRPAGEGFYERGITHRIEAFGNIAHIWSTYEARHHPNDDEPFVRGINSFQFVYQNKRWWVLTILWDIERADN